jgi:ATP-dependent Lhr-like helicase
MDIAIELPGSPLEPVMALEVWEEIYDRLAALVEEHRTTLVFVNTRRLAERAARHLADRIGADKVTSHHGSLSRELRLDAEQRLKSGQLRALVATASLELGIDIGAIDLVCQLGSTRSISTFLQRVGRSGHHVGGLPQGRLFPLSRDELVESVALIDSVQRGELDRLCIPDKPLDILAQQIVAAVSADEWTEEDLLAMIRRAWPYRGVTEAEFEAVVTMLSEGFSTRRGRRSALIHRDGVNRRLRGRRGSQLTAITSGGAIPDVADYEVVLEPEGQSIGTLNEDFAIESMAGDIFQLGTHSWRILRVESSKVRVEDARGQAPTIPFWLGEAPGRTDELSASVSRLRESVSERLGLRPVPRRRIEAPLKSAKNRGKVPFIVEESEAPETAVAPAVVPAEAPAEPIDPSSPYGNALSWLTESLHLSDSAAEQVLDYLAAGKAALGEIPSQHCLVMERFFDEVGGMQLVLHSPFGSRLNRAWGLALRKRFCRKFNFELQAAATEDAIVLSLGQTHSFPLDEVWGYLRADNVRDVLSQAVLAAPLFPTRWRWNATRALAIPRWRGGRKVPPQLQRMNAEDLMAVVFPDQLACAENLAGAREIPDHPLVTQTMRDCLEEAMDIEGLERLLTAIEAGSLRLLTRDLPEPSPLAQEILSARPYAYLDDAPLEERRTRAVSSRRWRDPESNGDLGALDAAAIDRVRGEAWPQVENADELHEALVLLGFLTEGEGRTGGFQAGREAFTDAGRAQPFDWRPFLEQLRADRRAAILRPAGGGALWVAAERLPHLRLAYPDAVLEPELASPLERATGEEDRDKALVELVRGRLEGLGPVTETELAAQAGLPPIDIRSALAALEAEGFVLRGHFSGADVPGNSEETEWCERRLLARIHRYTLNRLRQEIEPVSATDYLRFLFEWQGLSRDEKPEGVEALAAVLDQLEGFEAPAAAWEAEILPSRLNGYDPLWLDGLCLSGRVLWARLTPPQMSGNAAGAPRGGRGWAPVKATPVAFVARRTLRTWRALLPSAEPNLDGLSTHAREIAEHLQAAGASFFDDFAAATRMLPTQVEVALGELVSAGLISSDGFQGLRTLITPSRQRPPPRGGRRSGSTAALGMAQAGRWSLVQAGAALPALADQPVPLGKEEVEAVARTLLRRYGVVFRKLLERERNLPPWRELLGIYRRLEARGDIRGGRFVQGFSGEQFALPEALGALREVRRKPPPGRWISLSGADPLNLLGIVTPGPRLTSVASNRALFRDGQPVAVREGGATRFLAELEPAQQWEASHALLRRNPPVQMRVYQGSPG